VPRVMHHQPLFSAIADYLRALSDEAIAPGRLLLLDELSAYVQTRLRDGQTARLIFICTHNSRRSHLAQVWAQIAAHASGVAPVECFSGGTEITACHPSTLAALARAGLHIQTITRGENPVHLLQYAHGVGPIVAFSKRYDQPPNPTKDFAAVMTCAQADEHCPFVAGAHRRFALTYADPKQADGTPSEAAAYNAACRLIAAEMSYLFRKVGSSFPLTSE